MHTLLDVESRPRDITSLQSAASEVVGGWGPRPSVRLPADGGSLALPRTAEGIGAWVQGAPSAGPLTAVANPEPYRVLLATQPSFVMKLPDPSLEALIRLGEDPESWRRESATAYLTAAAVEDGERRYYGLARSTLVENKLGFGQSAFAQHEEVWFDDRDQFEESLADMVGDSAGASLRPEPGSRAWSSVVLLLTNAVDEIDLPSNWVYHLKVVGGLYAVDLEIEMNTGTRSRSIIKELQTAAPNGLVVSVKSVPGADDFLAVFLKAREGGFCTTMGTAETKNFSDYVLELAWALRAFNVASASAKITEDTPWTIIANEVRALQASYFELTKNADDSLDNNPYPKPKRMLDHLESLERLAKEHREKRAQLGARLADAAREHGIEIALFDGSRPDKGVLHCGKDRSTRPHVKVDDYKSAPDCGRIYFAVCTSCFTFVVDHIGLHDYY